MGEVTATVQQIMGQVAFIRYTIEGDPVPKVANVALAGGVYEEGFTYKGTLVLERGMPVFTRSTPKAGKE